MVNKNLLLKIVAIYEVLGGLYLLYSILPNFSGLGSLYVFLIFAVVIVLSILSIVAGVLLWQGKQKGVSLSTFVQAIQLLTISLPGIISWFFYLGVVLGFVGDITLAQFNYQLSYGGTFRLALGNGAHGSILFGINFIPLVILLFLSKQKLKRHH